VRELVVTPQQEDGMNEKAIIFWDNSNIFIPAQYVALKKDGALQQRAVRIHFDNLCNLARAGRELVKAICVGSVPPELDEVWKKLRATGISVELYERGSGSGKEQGVDQCLQVHMLRALADIKDPVTAVLLTGDGAGYEDGIGFHADLERMAKAGWGIEVLSWDTACNKRLKAWAQTVGVYVPLESYYETVTFLQKGRNAKALSLKRRQRAQPTKP
jgi:hypothetical protein